MNRHREILGKNVKDGDLYRQTMRELPRDITGLQGKIKSMFIGPIKSLGLVPVTRARVTQYGLSTEDFGLSDRMAMLGIRKPSKTPHGQPYDFERFSQKDEPRLALTELSYDGNFLLGTSHLTVAAPEADSIRLNTASLKPRAVSDESKMSKVRMSNESNEVVRAVRENSALTQWIQEVLDRLPGQKNYNPRDVEVLLPVETERRPVLPQHRALQKRAATWFSDGGQMLWTSEGTLEWMNRAMVERKKKMKKSGARHISMEAFRPNVVIQGFPPNIEDVIRSVIVGQTQVSFADLCVRCDVTRIDESGKRSRDGQPLAWLNQHRPKRPDSKRPTFGVNTVSHTEESGRIIQVGDRVEILSEKE